jgi:Ribosomal proteins 50S-L15, 50S-L18e, 60S-L27A
LITPDVLKHDRLIRDQKTRQLPLKVLGGGDAPKGVTIHAHAFTRSALEKLAAAGSTAQRLSWPENLPVEDIPEERPQEPPAAQPEELPEVTAQASEPEPAVEGTPEEGTPEVDTAEAES